MTKKSFLKRDHHWQALTSLVKSWKMQAIFLMLLCLYRYVVLILYFSYMYEGTVVHVFTRQGGCVV